MNKKLIIFGISDFAEVVHYYFLNDSAYEIVAFTVDKEYIPESKTFLNLPIVDFEKIKEIYPPAEYEIFIAAGYSALNAIRKEKFYQAKAMGYTMASYISSKACVFTDKIGEHCFILEQVNIQPFVTIHDNVMILSTSLVAHHSTVHAHTFIASHAVINGFVTIGEQCFIGANATLRDKITIKEKCVIGAGALILENAQKEGLYIGNISPRSNYPSTKLKKI